MSMSVQRRPPVARRYKRFIVTGSVALQSAAGEFCAKLLNLGRGGMLVRTDVLCREGTELGLRFQTGSYPETCAALGEVVGAKEDLLAIKFRGEPARMDALLCWLERENVTWSGVT